MMLQNVDVIPKTPFIEYDPFVDVNTTGAIYSASSESTPHYTVDHAFNTTPHGTVAVHEYWKSEASDYSTSSLGI